MAKILACRDLGNQAPSSLSYKHIKNFTKDLEVRWDLGNWASPVNLACDCKYVCCSQASLGQEIKRTVNLKKSKVSLNDRFDGWFGPSLIFVHSLCSFSLWIASDNEFKKMWCRKHVLTHTDSVLGLRWLVRNLNFSSACCCLRADVSYFLCCTRKRK